MFSIMYRDKDGNYVATGESAYVWNRDDKKGLAIEMLSTASEEGNCLLFPMSIADANHLAAEIFEKEKINMTSYDYLVYDEREANFLPVPDDGGF